VWMLHRSCVQHGSDVGKVKDLGVIIDSKLTFEDHITEKVNKAYAILGIIKRNFDHIGKDAFVLLYKSLGIFKFSMVSLQDRSH